MTIEKGVLSMSRKNTRNAQGTGTIRKKGLINKITGRVDILQVSIQEQGNKFKKQLLEKLGAPDACVHDLCLLMQFSAFRTGMT